MLLHDLLDDLELRNHVLEVRGDTHIDLDVIVHDSRDARPGTLFCCIPGARSDGHDHAPAAVAAGAVALLVERMLPVDVPQVRVDSVRRTLGPLCSRFQGEPSHALRVLGVTGTNGKTSTTYLLEAIARANGERAGVIGTVEARVDGTVVPLQHTTPEATDLQALLARMRDAGVHTVAMEVSSHALDQHRVDATRFAAVTFTNLTHEHLDYHPTVESYFEAKASLFDPRFSARAAINIDDEHGVLLVERARARGMQVCTYSIDDPTADVYARGVLLRRDESLFELVDNRHDHTGVVRSPLVGSFNVANALAAAATALVVGFSFEAVRRRPRCARASFPGASNGSAPIAISPCSSTTRTRPTRWSRCSSAARTLVDGGKLVVVFGCGGDRDRSKRPADGRGRHPPGRHRDPHLRQSALRGSRGDRARRARRRPRRPRGPTVVLDRRAAIRAAFARPGRGDVVVIAGKGHETGQTFAGVTTPFDDRVVAVEELERVLVSVLTAREIAHRAGGRVVGRSRRGCRCVGLRFADARPRARASSRCRARATATTSSPFAFDAGAHVALVAEDFAGGPALATGRAFVHVGDTLGALQQVARTLRADRPELHVVAVAGSTGKTSTKDLLAAVLASRGCYANAESYNNEFGLPITLLQRPRRRARGRDGDGGAVRGRPRSALRHRPSRHGGRDQRRPRARRAPRRPGRRRSGAGGAGRAPCRPTGIAVLNADDPATPQLARRHGRHGGHRRHRGRRRLPGHDVEVDDRLQPSFALRGERFASAAARRAPGAQRGAGCRRRAIACFGIAARARSRSSSSAARPATLAYGVARDRCRRDRAQRRVQRQSRPRWKPPRWRSRISSCPSALGGSPCSATCASSARTTTRHTAPWASAPRSSVSTS